MTTGFLLYLHATHYSPYTWSIADAKETSEADWSDGEIDYSTITLEKLRAIVARDGPYYPVVEGSDNPYRDGYVTEPPKKPRASYLFFQCTMRSYYQRLYPNAVQSELMTILGAAWGKMSEEERAPYLQLANEESKQYEKERVMLEKAQRPNEVWQPLRRCYQVLDRLSKDSFAEIFLEPVDTEEFPDYLELIDNPMDLGTVRTKLATKKYQAAEQFARDMRRVRANWDSSSSCFSFVTNHNLNIWSHYRFGTIARFITSMAPPFGMLLTTCQNSLNDCTMLGCWSFANGICDGPIHVRGLGSTLAGSTMASVAPLTTKWSCATIAMPCMVLSASTLL